MLIQLTPQKLGTSGSTRRPPPKQVSRMSSIATSNISRRFSEQFIDEYSQRRRDHDSILVNRQVRRGILTTESVGGEFDDANDR